MRQDNLARQAVQMNTSQVPAHLKNLFRYCLPKMKNYYKIQHKSPKNTININK